MIKPYLNDAVEVVTTDGIKMTVARLEERFPDQEIEIFVTINGQNILTADIDSHLTWYNYQNDIVDHYSEIVKEYHSDDTSVYQFNWGIIYTLDGGVTFSALAKHEYLYYLMDLDMPEYPMLDDEAKQIVEMLD